MLRNGVITCFHRFIGIIFIIVSGYDHSLGQEVFFRNDTHLIDYVTGTMGQAKCAVDINGDGLDDITRVSKDGLYFEIQQVDGSFEHRFYPLAIKMLPQWSISAGDLDVNGTNDLVFGSKQGISIIYFYDNGNKLEEVVLPEKFFAQRSTMVDIDGDGFLDVFVCNDIGQSLGYRNDKTGRLYLDNSLIKTSELAGNYSAIWSDLNNDGKSDLYISKCKAEALPGNPQRTNLYYQNNGNGTFAEKGKLAGIDDNAQSWTSVVEDMDNDGDMDIFVVNHDQKNRLYRNNQDGTFTDVIESSGIDPMDLGGFEALGGDFNNDGFIDIISDLTKSLYLGNGDLTFTGMSLPFKIGTVGDFNHDGFLDVTQRSELWTNVANTNHWITISLKGVESNSNGIGSRVELYGGWGTQYREVRSGQSFSPMHSLNIHFGMGNYGDIDSLIIRWPSGIVSKILSPSIDSHLQIVESTCYLVNKKIEVDKTQLCPQDVSTLTVPQGYAKYIWTNGHTNQTLVTNVPGNYQVVYQDVNGCRGISPLVNIEKADLQIPTISILNNPYHQCQGSQLVLQSSAGLQSLWSNGKMNMAEISVDSSGIYSVGVDSFCGNGILQSAPVSIDFFEVQKPTLQSITQLQDQIYEVKINADSCVWYGKNDEFLFSGCQPVFNDIDKDTVFYVANVKSFAYPQLSGGKQDTAGFKVNLPANRKMYFSVWKPFVLDSVDMYIKDSMSMGDRMIALLDQNKDTIQTTMVSLHVGKNQVKLGFKLQPGHYALVTNRSDQLLNVGPLDYPFPLGDLGQIDSSSVSLNFYPYFYHWKVRPIDSECTSEKLAVPIIRSSTYETERRIAIFPNPAFDLLYISSDVDVDYVISDISGQLMKKGKSNLGSLSIEDLLPGIYHINIQTNNASYNHRFVVVR